jgi:hypothetical protein
MSEWVTIAAQVFEAGMLVCFGFAWPIDILRTLKRRRVEGKSVTFMGIVLMGYMSGLTAKFIAACAGSCWPQPVTALYALNAILVAVDIALVIHFRGGLRK